MVIGIVRMPIYWAAALYCQQEIYSEERIYNWRSVALNPKGKGSSISNGRKSNPTAKGVKVLLGSLSSSCCGTSGPLCKNRTSSTQYSASSSMIPLKPSSSVDTTPIRLAARLPHMAKATRPPSSSPKGIMLSAFTTRPAQPARASGFRSRLCLPASCPPKNSLPAAVGQITLLLTWLLLKSCQVAITGDSGGGHG